MGFTFKGIIFLFVVMVMVGCANASTTQFLNWSYHNASDNSTTIFIENSMKLANGSFSLPIGDVSFASVRYSGDLSTTSFETEVWANTTGTWASDPYKLILYFFNEDSGLGYNETWNVYKNRGVFDINYWSCTLSFSKCIFMENMGTVDAVNGGYFYVLERSATDVAKNLGLSSGWLDPKELSTLLYGWTYQNSEVTNAGRTQVYSTASLMNSLTHIDSLGEPELLSGLGDTITETNLPYLVKFRGYFSPYDLGIAIVDNTTLATNSDIQGYTHVLNSSGVVAYKETDIKTYKSYLNKTFGGKLISIYDMEISGEITDTDYNDLMTDGDYYLVVYQKRRIYNDYYWLTLGVKQFTYAGGSANLKNQLTYSYDMNGQRLYNTTLADLWLSVYDFSVTDAVANDKLQNNFLDVLVYCTNTTGSLTYMPYSVYTDSAGVLRFTVQIGDYASLCENNKFYIAYGSDTVTSSNAYYVSDISPRVQLVNRSTWGTSNFDNDILSVNAVQNIQLDLSIHGVQSGNTECWEIKQGTTYINSMEYVPSNWKVKDQCGGTIADTNTDKINWNVSTGAIYETVSGSAFYTATIPTQQYMLRMVKTGSTFLTTVPYFGVGYIYTNFWTLNQLGSTETEQLIFREVSFTKTKADTWVQKLYIETDNTIRSLKFYVDKDIKDNIILDPIRSYTITEVYTLSNGEHTLEAKLGDSVIDHEVYISDSNVTENEDTAQHESVNESDIGTGANAYTQGSISAVVSNLSGSLFGTWAVTPYIASLIITIGLVYLTRNAGVGAIALLSTLFVFSMLGWISGAIQISILIGGSIVLLYLVYVTIRTGG